MTIHVALVSAHPTEADARRVLHTMPHDTPYLGVWLLPTHENLGDRPEAHAFSDDAEPSDLTHAGWERA